MWWIIVLVVGILLLLVVLLTIPIDLVFSVERSDSLKMKARVKWMFGLVGKDIGRGKKREPKEPAKKRKGNILSLVAAFTTEGFAQKFLSFLRDAVRALKVRELKANVTVGLGNPADTGMLFAVIVPTMVFFRSLASVNVEVEPDFEEEKLQGYCAGNVRATPLKFMTISILFLFSTTTLRALRASFRARKAKVPLLERPASQ